MAFKQIFSSAKTDHVEPYILILQSGVIVNPAAIDEIGKENERALAFYDKKTNRLAFVFMRATIAGSYSFSPVAKSRSRRIGISRFLKMNKILEKANGSEFPLQVLKETVPGFEGSTIFFADLAGKKEEPSAISRTGDIVEEAVEQAEMTPKEKTQKVLDDADRVIEREKKRREQAKKGWPLCTVCNSNRTSPANKKGICTLCQTKRKTDRPYVRK